MRIDGRFSGFPDLALGGYVAGLLARDTDVRDAVEVRLERPVRIGDDVAVVADALVRDGERVASIRPIALDAIPPRIVAPAEAERVSAEYLGHRHHLFPRCFCCGSARGVGDGLRIFPGPAGGGLVAAPWRPADAVDGAIVPTEIVWSALDCPGIWAQVLVTTGAGERVVTGSLALALRRPVPARETVVVLGWPIGRQGRRIEVGAAIVGERGDVLALARQTMVVTERGVPLDLETWTSGPAPY